MSGLRSWKVGGIAAAVLLVLVLAWQLLGGTAEFLAFRAARSASASNAERDFERIVRLYKGSRQRENALLRLAQFQFARGAHQAALGTLEILGREFGDGSTATTRRLLTAKAQLASADTVAACAAVPDLRGAPVNVPADLSDAANLTRECAGYSARADSARAAAAKPPVSATPQAQP